MAPARRRCVLFPPGCVDIQLMPACKWRLSVLLVLTYPNVRSAPVLEIHHFRLGLIRISAHLDRPQRNQLIAGARHGNHPIAGGRRVCRRSARTCRQRHRRGGRGIGGLRDRPGADQRHAAHRRPPPDGRATLHRRGGRVDPPRLRRRACRRNNDLGDAVRGSQDHTPPGRQDGAEGHRVQLFLQCRLCALRRRGIRHQTGVGGRAGGRPQQDRSPDLHGFRRTACRPADRGEAGGGQRAGLSRHGVRGHRAFRLGRLWQSHPAVPVRGASPGRLSDDAPAGNLAHSGRDRIWIVAGAGHAAEAAG